MNESQIRVWLRDECTQGSVNSCRDLRICTAHRNLLFCKQQLKMGSSPFSAVLHRVEPNAELYSDIRKYIYDFNVCPKSSNPVYIVSYHITFIILLWNLVVLWILSVWSSSFQICTVDVVSWKFRYFYTVLTYPYNTIIPVFDKLVSSTL